MIGALRSLIKSPLVRLLLGAMTVVAAGIGFVSDLMGLRDSSDVVSTTVAAVLVSESTSAPTLPASSTTLPLNPEQGLEKLRISLAARSSTGVLDVCGQTAFLLTNDGLRYFEYTNDDGWIELNNYVSSPTETKPIGLLVVKNAPEGKAQVLVVFERSGSSDPLSGVLGVPTNAIGCGAGFGWRYFNHPDGSLSKLVPSLNPSASGFTSSEKTSTTSETSYVWNGDKDVYLPVVSAVSTEISTSGVVGTQITQQFIENYAQFSSASFMRMLTFVEPGSPAEQLVKFLLVGKRASKDAGYGEGSGFLYNSNAGVYRIEFPNGGSEFSNFVGTPDLISGFSLNGLELEKLIRLDYSEPISSRRCSPSGVCVGLRGVQLGIRTTYAAIEVESLNANTEVKFVNAWLVTGTGRQRNLASTNSKLGIRTSKTWSASFALSDLPWGGTIEVEYTVAGVREIATLQVML